MTFIGYLFYCILILLIIVFSLCFIFELSRWGWFELVLIALIFSFTFASYYVSSHLSYEAIKIDGEIVKSTVCYEVDEHKFCEDCFGKEYAVVDYWEIEE